MGGYEQREGIALSPDGGIRPIFFRKDSARGDRGPGARSILEPPPPSGSDAGPKALAEQNTLRGGPHGSGAVFGGPLVGQAGWFPDRLEGRGGSSGFSRVSNPSCNTGGENVMGVFSCRRAASI